MHCFKTPVFFGLSNLHAFNEQELVHSGSVIPHTSSVYFYCWCVVFERDGSDLMFVLAFWYVVGFDWAC